MNLRSQIYTGFGSAIVLVVLLFAILLGVGNRIFVAYEKLSVSNLAEQQLTNELQHRIESLLIDLGRTSVELSEIRDSVEHALSIIAELREATEAGGYLAEAYEDDDDLGGGTRRTGKHPSGSRIT